MEPDKTYPLHSDDNSQQGPPATPADNQQDSQLELPSTDGQFKGTASALPDAVPWYLRPLTKTTESPLTSTQTRPFVPRQPLSSSQQQYEPKQPPIQSSSQSTPSDQRQSQFLPRPAAQQPEPASSVASETPPPLSPFRSPSIAPSTPQYTRSRQPSALLSSADRFQVPGQLTTPGYRPASPEAVPKPFSQFGTHSSTHPVDTVPPKPKNFRKLTGIVAAVLLVGAIGAGVYSLWRSNNTQFGPAGPAAAVDAEDKLHQAIENHLSTGKIRQVFEQTVTAADTSTFKIDATSDFSDPRAPKSHIVYELKSGKNETIIDGAGILIVPSPSEYYGKLTKPVLFYDGSEDTKPKENQWYTITGNDTVGEMLLDPLSARMSINSSLGEFPVGSFSEGTRRQLMQYIRDHNVYKVTSSESVEIDSKKMTRYTIEFNADAVNELNRRIYASIGGNPEEVPITFTKNGTHKTEVWVSDDITKITRIKIERESETDDGIVKESVMVNITYPNDVSKIKKPESVQLLP